MHQTAPYAMFSRQEMSRRYDKARELMRRRQLDALLITGDENFQYFAGTSASLALHCSLSRPSVFILPTMGEPIILTQSKSYIIDSTYVSDIREYFDVLAFPPALVVEALKDVRLHHHRLGVELGREQRMGIPVGAYLALVDALPRLQFMDAADVIIRCRMVKSSEELAYIKQAADVTARARQRLFSGGVTPGMTERDVARTIGRLILEEGGDRTAFPAARINSTASDPCRRGRSSPSTPGPTSRCTRSTTRAWPRSARRPSSRRRFTGWCRR